MLKGNKLTSEIIAAAIEVHRHLGPGLLESTYEECLNTELAERGLCIERQLAFPVFYKGHRLNTGYRIDLLVNEQVVIELKAVQKIEPIHLAQLLTYMKLSDKKYGLLLNFNVPLMKNGIRRLLNG